MKKFIIYPTSYCLILLIASLTIIFCAHASRLPGKRIKQIRQNVEEINQQLKTYQMTKRDVNELSSEGGELIVYKKGKKPRKLSLVLFFEMGKHSELYYLKNNSLIYVEITKSHYNKPFGHVTKRESQRFYFNDGDLVFMMAKEPSKTGLKAIEERLHANTKRYLSMIKKRSVK